MVYHAIQRLIGSGTPSTLVCYVAVDNPIYNQLHIPSLLDYLSKAAGRNITKESSYVFLDEVQYLRDWERHLKTAVDSYPSVKFIVSGSAAAALRLKSTESGAGRFTDFLLPPLTFHEFLVLLRRDDLLEAPGGAAPFPIVRDIAELNRVFLEYLNFGGYPEALFSAQVKADPGRFIKSDIIDKVLLRDLPSLYGIENIQELNYLFTTLAFNTAGEISLEELSKSSGVAKNTIKKYIQYLEAAFLLKVIHRVDRSAKRFLRATHFKVYLTNPSLRAALFSPANEGDPAIESLAETAVFSQWFHWQSPRLHYARWDKGEVDIVCLGGDQRAAWAVEVKWTDRYFDRPSDLSALIGFCIDNKLPGATVTTISKTGKKSVRGITLDFVPAALYCYTVGLNLLRHQIDHLEPGSLSEMLEPNQLPIALPEPIEEQDSG
jgi:hypothetical protein